MAKPLRVFLLGSTGTIGRAVAHELSRRGIETVCFVRGAPGSIAATNTLSPCVSVRFGGVDDPGSLEQVGFRGEHFDVLVSCMASRTGAPRDAWAVDYLAHCHALAAARRSGVAHVVLLSAICVQKPVLAFQKAKLAFEKVLVESGVNYSIVRPTAFFKSLCGQIERVRQGKPFLVFGDGTLTACKPVSDADLANYLIDCLDEETRLNRILPIGGPGNAITPREQGECLFSLLKRPPRFRSVPPMILDGAIGALSVAGRLSKRFSDKAELARIGRYYATESMLVLNPKSGRYDAAATPSTGTQTLFDYYAQVIAGERLPDRGDHAVF